MANPSETERTPLSAAELHAVAESLGVMDHVWAELAPPLAEIVRERRRHYAGYGPEREG